MAVKNILIQTQGTEYDFVNAIADSLISVGNGHIKEAAHGSSRSYKAQLVSGDGAGSNGGTAFCVVVDDLYEIWFYRHYDGGANANNSFDIKYVHIPTGTEQMVDTLRYINQRTYASNTNHSSFKLRIQAIVEKHFIKIVITSSPAASTIKSVQFFLFSDNGFILFRFNNDLLFTLNNKFPVTMINRLPYIADSTNLDHIDIIRSKSMTSAIIQSNEVLSVDNVALEQTNVLFDCSTLPEQLVDTVIIFEGKQYYVLNQNTLIQV